MCRKGTLRFTLEKKGTGRGSSSL
ncbi:unnamed protein product [Linum tenue]|uniref:Uncharacterized protein n=1 Tax=Linum tenue TaxID=586396 RepID=A0AAV0GVE8_9ROSI|nr:unnamed protein product [Linum tenue]